MATLSATHAALVAAIGTTEHPPRSNCQVFSHELGRPCESWCADCLVCIVGKRLGVKLPSMSASCIDLMAAFKHAGKLSPVPIAGSFAFFHWPGEHAGANHVGWVEPGAILPSSFFDIEGNTSFASDRNGGIVMRRQRPRALAIGFGVVDYEEEPPVPTAPPIAFYVPQLAQVEIDLVQDVLHYPELIRGVGATGVPFSQYGLQVFDPAHLPSPRPGSLGVNTNVTGWDQITPEASRYATRLKFLSRIGWIGA